MRKIGELKGKPIVEGNPNEVKNNQIHAKTEGDNITLSERKNGSLETISGGSSGGGGKIRYYKFIKHEGSPNLEAVQRYFSFFPMPKVNDFIYYGIRTTGMITTGRSSTWSNSFSDFVNINVGDLYGFSYIEDKITVLYSVQNDSSSGGIIEVSAGSLEDMSLEFIKKQYLFLVSEEELEAMWPELEASIKQLYMTSFEEITEDEYNKLATIQQ